MGNRRSVPPSTSLEPPGRHRLDKGAAQTDTLFSDFRRASSRPPRRRSMLEHPHDLLAQVRPARVPSRRGADRTCGSADDEDRRAQQLQGGAGLSRALQEGHGARGRGDQRQGRRARQEARGDLARRRRQSGRCRAGRRRAGDARRDEPHRRHVPLQCRPRGHRVRRQEAGVLPRRGAVDRQDHLAERQQVHLPPARPRPTCRSRC